MIEGLKIDVPAAELVEHPEYRRRSSAVRRGFDRASKEAFRVVGDFDGCYPDEVGADMPVELYFEVREGGRRLPNFRRAQDGHTRKEAQQWNSARTPR
jgi:hypothetical protein